ncbi:MAG: hypothetical protein WC796_04585 [Candidatus Pacearchaeota archaeon]|jgi:hypothetical protein
MHYKDLKERRGGTSGRYLISEVVEAAVQQEEAEEKRVFNPGKPKTKHSNAVHIDLEKLAQETLPILTSIEAQIPPRSYVSSAGLANRVNRDKNGTFPILILSKHIEEAFQKELERESLQHAPVYEETGKILLVGYRHFLTPTPNLIKTFGIQTEIAKMALRILEESTSNLPQGAFIPLKTIAKLINEKRGAGERDKEGRRIHTVQYPALISVLERYDEVRPAIIFDGYGKRGFVAYATVPKTKKR